MTTIIFNAPHIRRVQLNDLPDPKIISIRRLNGVWHLHPLACNDNLICLHHRAKQTKPKLDIIFDLINNQRILAGQMARWASIMQSMGYFELAGEMDAFADDAEIKCADALLNISPYED